MDNERGFNPNQQTVSKKKNWGLIIFISVIVGIIVIALIAWAVLYSRGEVGIIGTSSNVDIFCKECTGDVKVQCQNKCETEFAKIGAPLLVTSHRTQTLGEQNLVLCNCEGRLEDFNKILSGVDRNWDEFLAISAEEGKKFEEAFKEGQKEKRQGNIGVGNCEEYYDQQLKGLSRGSPDYLGYIYPQCILQDLFNKEDLSKVDLSICDNEFVYKNSNDICKYMIAYQLKDGSVCEEADFGLSGSKEKCLDVLNSCSSNSRSCIETLALVSGDSEICKRDYEKAEFYRRDCILNSNIFTGEVSACEEIENMEENADYCYMNVARFTKDETYCDNVQPGKSSRDCHLVVAVAKRDISICEGIKVGDTGGIQNDYDFQVNICNDGYNEILF